MPWPVSLYKLIHREDIINNLMQSDSTSNANSASGGITSTLGSKAQKQSLSSRTKHLSRQQSLEIKRAMLKRRQTEEYALHRHESNVFSGGSDDQVTFAAGLIQEELQQTKAQNALVQELIGGNGQEA